MRLNELAPVPGARRKAKRVGRGNGSGLGKTAGRGNKGQKSRAGGGTAPWFEGGQMPLQRRVPKRGFTNIFREAYSIVNVEALGRFAEGSEVGPVELAGAGLISKADALVKLLGSGSLDRPVTVRVHRASASAVEKIRAAGGQVQLIPVKKE